MKKCIWIETDGNGCASFMVFTSKESVIRYWRWKFPKYKNIHKYKDRGNKGKICQITLKNNDGCIVRVATMGLWRDD